MKAVDKDYTAAGLSLRAGYTLAHHLTAGEESLLDAMIGIAATEVMNEQTLELLQEPDAPSLRQLAGEMPRPRVEIEGSLNAEQDRVRRAESNPLVRAQLLRVLQPSLAGADFNATRANAQWRALEILDNLREYAGEHEGTLPEKLEDPLPASTERLGTFNYERKATNKAVLTIRFAEPAHPAEFRYEITLKPVRPKKAD